MQHLGKCNLFFKLISALTGVCYFFVRTTSKPISTSNIANEVNFGILDAREGGLLKGIEELLGRVMVPALKAQTNWGQLTANGGGNEQQVIHFRCILPNVRFARFCVWQDLGDQFHEVISPFRVLQQNNLKKE